MIQSAREWNRLCNTAADGVKKIVRLASSSIPFLFVIDAWAQNWIVLELPEAKESGIAWDIKGRGNLGPPESPPKSYQFFPSPPEKSAYKQSFDVIRNAQIAGDTYLANLTCSSPLNTDLNLESIARSSQAPFRLYIPGLFTMFSPERFVRIEADGRISTCPMKGTIDASLPNAREQILADRKESAEHVTIVDLLRNDLGKIAKNVHVPRYRYITETGGREHRLLQVSSEVSGELGVDWRNRLGTILTAMLPAGSVTGAPKIRTCEIIRESEDHSRGWYTGVFGVFDGNTMDSAVMIRFVEVTAKGNFVYKSGGGITIYSDIDSEYEELKAKIYAPFS